jgi:hypothetical protein
MTVSNIYDTLEALSSDVVDDDEMMMMMMMMTPVFWLTTLAETARRMLKQCFPDVTLTIIMAKWLLSEVVNPNWVFYNIYEDDSLGGNYDLHALKVAHVNEYDSRRPTRILYICATKSQYGALVCILRAARLPFYSAERDPNVPMEDVMKATTVQRRRNRTPRRFIEQEDRMCRFNYYNGSSWFSLVVYHIMT